MHRFRIGTVHSRQRGLIVRLPFVHPGIDDLPQSVDHECAPLGGHRRRDQQHACIQH